MVGIKEIINNISYQDDEISKRISGNRKAAKLAYSSSAHKPSMKKGGQWSDTLHTYSDYFIRY